MDFIGPFLPGAASVMTSLNDVNGVSATINNWLINDVLRTSWS